LAEIAGAEFTAVVDAPIAALHADALRGFSAVSLPAFAAAARGGLNPRRSRRGGFMTRRAERAALASGGDRRV